MKIYYEVDCFTDNCLNKCPFVDIGYKGETGKDCQVGSVDCQECKFCYGHGDNNDVFQMSYINGEQFVRPMPYIKCMWGGEQHSMCKRIQRVWYRIKYYFKYELHSKLTKLR